MTVLAEAVARGSGTLDAVQLSGVTKRFVDVVAVAARDRKGQLIDMRQTLRHELAHLALGDQLDPAHPRGRIEGLQAQPHQVQQQGGVARGRGGPQRARALQFLRPPDGCRWLVAR